MKRKKTSKVISLMLALVMVITMMPGQAFASSGEKQDKGNVLGDGIYKASIRLMHKSLDQLALCAIFFDGNVDIVVKGDEATLKFLVAKPVPAFPDQGEDGTVKNVVIDYNEQQYTAKSQLGTDAKMTPKYENPSFGLEEGKEYSAQVLTVKLPAAAIHDNVFLNAKAYVNVWIHEDENLRIALGSIVRMADYSNVDAALATIPNDLSQYTEDTVKAVTDARDAVERGLEFSRQGDVDRMAAAIEEAVAGLIKSTTLKNGVYNANISIMHETKEQPSILEPLFGVNADIVLKGEEATLKFYIVNPVPAFPNEGADGTVKNVVITIDGQQYEATSQLGTDAKMTAKSNNALFGVKSGEKYNAQVLTVKLPAKEIYEETNLNTNVYENVVTKATQAFRIVLSNFVKMADYSKVDEALATIPKDLSQYTEDTVRAVTEARDGVERGLDFSRQTDVDNMAIAITEAVSGLEKNTGLENGVYKTMIDLLHESQEQRSIYDILFDSNVDIVVKDDEATLKLLVVNPVPAFPNLGADGTVKNVVINYDGQNYTAESQLGTDAKMTPKDENPSFGLEVGKEYSAQVLTVKLPVAAIHDNAFLNTKAYMNVLFNTDVTFRIALGNLVKMADYSKVDAALATIPKDLSQYTEDTVRAVTEARDAVKRGLEFSRQGDVDNMAKAITEAVAGLRKIEKPVKPIKPVHPVIPDVPSGDVTPVPPVKPTEPAEKPEVAPAPILPIKPPTEGANVGMTEEQQKETDAVIGLIIENIIKPAVKPEPPVDPEMPVEPEKPVVPQTEAEKETAATEEKIAEAAKNNEQVKVNVETEKLVEEKAPEAIKKEIAEIKDKVNEIYSEVGGKLLQFANIEVKAEAVKADGTTENLGNLRNLDKKLAFTFQLPMNTEGNKFGVIRYHDGKTEIIPAEDVKYDPVTKKITFLTDKFSTYAVFEYEKEPEVAPVPPVKPVKPGVVKNVKVKTDNGLFKVIFEKVVDADKYVISIKQAGKDTWRNINVKKNSFVVKQLYKKPVVKNGKYFVKVAAIKDGVRGDYTVAKTIYANRIGTKSAKMMAPKFVSIKGNKVVAKKVYVKNTPKDLQYKVSYKLKGTKAWKSAGYSAKNVKFIKGLKDGRVYNYALRYRYKSTVDGKTLVYSNVAYKTVRVR